MSSRNGRVFSYSLGGGFLVACAIFYASTRGGDAAPDPGTRSERADASRASEEARLGAAIPPARALPESREAGRIVPRGIKEADLSNETRTARAVPERAVRPEAGKARPVGALRETVPEATSGSAPLLDSSRERQASGRAAVDAALDAAVAAASGSAKARPAKTQPVETRPAKTVARGAAPNPPPTERGIVAAVASERAPRAAAPRETASVHETSSVVRLSDTRVGRQEAPQRERGKMTRAKSAEEDDFLALLASSEKTIEKSHMVTEPAAAAVDSARERRVARGAATVGEMERECQRASILGSMPPSFCSCEVGEFEQLECRVSQAVVKN